MYIKSAAVAGALPITGAFLEFSWAVVAAATLLAAGLALLRLVPVREA